MTVQKRAHSWSIETLGCKHSLKGKQGRLPSFVYMAMPACPALASALRQQPPHCLQQPQAVPLDLLVLQGQGMQEGLQVVASKQLSTNQAMLGKLRVGGSGHEAVQGQGTSLLVVAASSCKQPW